MAVIGSIRKRSGLLIIIIGVALAAFVLGDLFRSNNGGRKYKNVGVIDGEDINPIEFNNKVEENIAIAEKNQKKKLTQDEVYNIKQTTWDNYVKNILLEKEYEKTGLSMTKDELMDRVSGIDPHPIIRQYFTDPQTGVYDRQNVIRFLKNLKSEQMDNETRQQWKELEDYIKKSSIEEQYDNLVGNSYNVAAPLVQYDYMLRNTRAEGVFVGIPYHKIPDNEVELTDKDYKSYYDKHKSTLERERSASIDYILFPIVPSEEDQQFYLKKSDETYQELLKTSDEDMLSFVNSVSEKPYDSSFIKAGDMPVRVEQELFNAEKGSILQPYKQNNVYYMAKLMDVQYRPDSMRASHILISYRGALNAPETINRTKEKAEELADSLYNVVKRSGNFNQLVQGFSDGPSKKDDGDLKWFADGAMIYPFNEAVIKGKVGSYKLVESRFGFHVIKITGKKDDVKKVKLALIEIPVTPSNVTYQKIYNQASMFSAENRNYDKFIQSASEKNYNIKQVPNLLEMSSRIAGLSTPREIIRWAFNEETNKGDVSVDIFQLDEGYVVAAVKDKQEKGIPSLEDVKEQIKPMVIREKKAEKIKNELNEQSMDLPQIAAKYQTKIDSLTNITLSAVNIKGFGREPAVIGSIFSLEKNQLSKPIQGEMGVYMVKVKDFVKPPKPNNLSMERQRAEGQFSSRVAQEAFKALKEESNIKDNRYMYY